MAVHMTQTQKQMARRLRARGLKFVEIARELDYTQQVIRVTVRGDQVRQGKPDDWSPAAGRLSVEEREEILLGLRVDESMSSIARRLGRSPSTVTREVAANGGAENYGAWRAHCRALRGAPSQVGQVGSSLSMRDSVNTATMCLSGDASIRWGGSRKIGATNWGLFNMRWRRSRFGW